MKQLVFVFFLLCLFVGQNAFSQDKIYFRDGSVKEAKVIHISDNSVLFKQAGNPDGPDYIEKKNSISKIEYANGTVEILSEYVDPYAHGRNIIHYHLLDVIYNDFTFSYEVINKTGKTGIVIPLAIGYNNDNYGSRDYINLIYTGIGLNVYPTGQHRISYFFGPELDVGIGKDEDYYWIDDPDDPYGYGYSVTEDKEFIYGRLIIKNGVSYSPVKNLSIRGFLGVGIKYYDIGDKYNSGVTSTAYFTLTMGYRF